MSAQLNHTIVWCRDKQVSAGFLAEMLGRPAPGAFGPFAVVGLDNGVSMDFHDTVEAIRPQHYAFLIGEADFDAVFGRIKARLTFLGISTDWLFPAADVRRFAEVLRNAGAHAEYREMTSDHGHDAFLAEQAELVRLLQ